MGFMHPHGALKKLWVGMSALNFWDLPLRNFNLSRTTLLWNRGKFQTIPSKMFDQFLMKMGSTHTTHPWNHKNIWITPLWNRKNFLDYPLRIFLRDADIPAPNLSNGIALTLIQQRLIIYVYQLAIADL